MAMFTTLPSVKYTQVLTTANLTGNGDSTNTDEVDTQGYKSLTFLVDMGNSGDTLAAGLYMELYLQESDTSATYSGGATAADQIVETSAGVYGAAASTTQAHLINAPTEDSKCFAIGYIGPYRYVRLVIARTGNHATGTPIGVIAVQEKADTTPVTQGT